MVFLTSARRARFDDADGPDRALHAVREVGDADQGHAHHVRERADRGARAVPDVRHNDEPLH